MVKSEPENLDRRMIRYGIDLNTIPKEEPESKVIILSNEPTPIVTILPSPRAHRHSYFAQPVLTAPPQPLLLDGAPPKGPVVKIPEGTKLLPPKHNEVLMGVKTNKKGEMVCTKYSTGDCTYFEGVCAHPSKVKFVPPKEAPKSALIASETPKKRRKTMADLEKELDAQCAIVASLEACQRLQSRSIISTDARVLKLEKSSASIEKRVNALEKPDN
jgi:hypothetical protein